MISGAGETAAVRAGRWRLRLDPPADGAANMARDLALLETIRTGKAQPTLRLYQWQPACVSLGRFQREEAVDGRLCRALGIDVVRRPSGGGAVLHQYELTYAVIAPVTEPLVTGGLRDAYARISAVLRTGLESLGLQIDPPQPVRRVRAEACFAAVSSFELSVDGKKLVGSAQVRRSGAVLQHGSILIDVDLALHERLFGAEARLAERVTTLRALLGRRPAPAEVAAAIVRGFATAGIRFGSERPAAPKRQG